MANKDGILYYPFIIGFSDGCRLLCHGDNYESGWKISFEDGATIICPHGKHARVDDEGKVIDPNLSEGGTK